MESDKKTEYYPYQIEIKKNAEGKWVAMLVPKIKPVPENFKPHYAEAA